MTVPERFTEFYDSVRASKKMEGLELTDCSIMANINGVLSATARADSQQMSYHYTLVSADMTVNGEHVTYDKDNGIVVG